MNLLEKIALSKTLIKAALKEFERVRLACSFGKDSIVVLHLALQIKPDIEVFFVNTPMKPPETLNYCNLMSFKWNLNLEIVESQQEVDENLWTWNPDLCCKIFKVEPTEKALIGVDCWITGLRNTEGKTRADFHEIEEGENITKLNPILTWTEREIWHYLASNHIPVHAWYKLGMRSLGCAPCTVIIDEKEEERDGRWKGTCKEGGECGIHTMDKEGKK